jgi:hypothetical protein
VTFEADLTALVVDPYNDFISDGGKLWPNVKETAEAVNRVSNMRDVLQSDARIETHRTTPLLFFRGRVLRCQQATPKRKCFRQRFIDERCETCIMTQPF